MMWDFQVPIFLTDQVLSFFTLGKYRPRGSPQRPLGRRAVALGSDMFLGKGEKAILWPKRKPSSLKQHRDYLNQDEPFSCWRKWHVKVLKKGSMEIRRLKSSSLATQCLSKTPEIWKLSLVKIKSQHSLTVWRYTIYIPLILGSQYHR